MFDPTKHGFDRFEAGAGARRWARAAALAAALGALGTGAGAGAATLEDLVPITGPSPFPGLDVCGDFPSQLPGFNSRVFVGGEVEPWVEFDPGDPTVAIATWQQDRWSDGGARGNYTARSEDGGKTWELVGLPNLSDCSEPAGPYERASDPWVSIGPGGTAYQMSLVFQTDPRADRVGGFGPNGMSVSRSTDGGETWEDPILLIADDDPRVLNDKNSLTADPTDANFAYAVWDRLKITAADSIDPENVRPGRGLALGVRFGLAFKGPIFLARTTDGGATWEPARQIYDPGANNQTIANQVAVLPDGTVVDVFTEILNNKNNDRSGPGFSVNLSLLRSSDKGATWRPRGQPIRANRMITNGAGAVTPDTGQSVRDAAILFDVAVDPGSGALYAVWQDLRFRGIEEVAFSQSLDGGFTWSAPVRINRTPFDAANPLRAQAFLPSVAVNGDGVIAVTYYDFRNDVTTGPPERELADHFVAFCDPADDCADPGSWGGEARLTDASFDYRLAPQANGLFLGDYMGLSSAGETFIAVFGVTNAAPDNPSDMVSRRFTP